MKIRFSLDTGDTVMAVCENGFIYPVDQNGLLWPDRIDYLLRHIYTCRYEAYHL